MKHVLAISFIVSAAAACGHHSGESDDPYTPDRIAKLKPTLQFKSVVIHPFTVEKAVEEPGAAPTDCHDAAVSYLSGKKLFDNVGGDGSAGAAGTLIVDADVTDLRIVSTGARVWVGAFAGKSHMTIKVTARDGATGTVLAEKVLESDNNAMGGAWSLGASDRGLPTDMGPVVADFVITTAQAAHPGGAAPAAGAPAAATP
jgi:hypothetical protein